MFESAIAFNQPIGNWNTTAVTNMGSMFWGASAFNQPIGNWNISAVTNMGAMFSFASAFNQNLCLWGSSMKMDVTSVSGMFDQANSCSNLSSPILTAGMTVTPLCYNCINQS